MQDHNFQTLQTFLLQTSGLSIQAEKTYLVESRLKSVADAHGCQSVDELAAKLNGAASPQLKTDVVEAMTTNETSFYRDAHPFETLRTHILPELVKTNQNSRSIRVFCAAASSGQEPYSVAMTIRESLPNAQDWKVDILGVDIDNKILDRAREGKYSKLEVQRGLPITLLRKYFDCESDNAWRIKPEIRNMVRFQQANLLKPFIGLGKFDIIFCRNVLIYFNPPTKADVLERLAALMPDNGTLILGGAETVLGITNQFAPLKGVRGLYAPVRGQLKSEAA